MGRGEAPWPGAKARRFRFASARRDPARPATAPPEPARSGPPRPGPPPHACTHLAPERAARQRAARQAFERHTPERTAREAPAREPAAHRRGARDRIVPVLVALALALPTAACDNSPADRAASDSVTEATAPTPASASTSTSARPALSPEELCTTAVRHWARRLLDGATPYGDYQSMGLSNRQYDILREVVSAARTAERDRGPRAARMLIDHQARAGCAAPYHGGGPTEGPWR
ncbi:hypothetical protein NGM36_12410 [Streptomyces mutabilis]|uniref:hypothetical protein n=1 Tax=Streptomyces mutabilis TaxID=67332 RepID=UPI0022BA31DE|nr:hypothetical protein [Streptomyces mutabilis]MCZ9350590.1 hypothetical protein [Streptomyces mutabilis]